MIKKFILAMAVLFTIVSCTRISFLHTISSNGRENILKKDLIGKWAEDHETDTVSAAFDSSYYIVIDSASSGDSGFMYPITVFEPGKDARLNFGDISYFNGELFELQGKLFLMLSTDHDHDQFKQIGRYNIATTIPAYYLVRIYAIESDRLEIGLFDGEEFMRLVKNKKITVKHEVIAEDDDGEPADVVVFEKSNELKKKLIELEKFPEVYKKVVYRKIK